MLQRTCRSPQNAEFISATGWSWSLILCSFKSQVWESLNLNILISIGCSGQYSDGIKKAFTIKACQVMGDRKKGFDFISHLVQETEESKGNFPSSINCSFKMSKMPTERTIRTICLCFSGVKVLHVQYIFFSLTPTQRVMAISAKSIGTVEPKGLSSHGG